MCGGFITGGAPCTPPGGIMYMGRGGGGSIPGGPPGPNGRVPGGGGSYDEFLEVLGR